MNYLLGIFRNCSLDNKKFQSVPNRVTVYQCSTPSCSESVCAVSNNVVCFKQSVCTVTNHGVCRKQ